ncbi:GOLPH3/VPS74 family protein [Pseudonocardia nigra]|uniref:GOLPH3/VPS74 family protein n=1 Tax=Pseudonocardia nigra TaxID=1921578 RepID=UPI001C605BAC|nr:GPP34 family phosphoprotein [Pseudonocardia nigra]
MVQDTLAERVFLILHDPFTGKPAVRASALKRAVTGAELAELILEHRIGMENDRIVLADARVQKTDYISSFVLTSIRGQKDVHSVPVWVAALAERLFDLVAGRLTNAGIVHRTGGPGLLRRSAQRFAATDLLAAARPRLRLEHMLRTPQELDVPSAACAAVLAAVGADRVLDVDGDRAAIRQVIAAARTSLPVDLRNLVTGLEVAHASAELPPSLRLRTSDR